MERKETSVDSYEQERWRQRLSSAFWAIVGLVGLGRPIVDRHAMYGDDPRNDPYSLDFDPDRLSGGAGRTSR
jgi:hypothetical protein